MTFQIKFLRAITAAPSFKAARLCALTLILTSFAGSAMAFNTYHAMIDDAVPQGSDSVNTTPIKQTPPPTIADSCLPLLKSIHQTSSNSAMDWNQRSAGRTASLGLVIGVRFALSPPKKPRSSVTSTSEASFGLWHANDVIAGDRHALAVSSYRQCQKDNALQAIGEFRWAR